LKSLNDSHLGRLLNCSEHWSTSESPAATLPGRSQGVSDALQRFSETRWSSLDNQEGV
jgi:hypothetical protein